MEVLIPMTVSTQKNENVITLPGDAKASQTKGTLYDELTPHPDPVGEEVFDDIVRDLRRYLFISEENALIAMFWVAHANVFNEFEHTPRLVITAPMKSCGKTALLSVLKAMTNRSLHGDNMTPACYFRLAAKGETVFFLDEADQWFGKRTKNRDLIAALNGGYQQWGRFYRTTGDNHDPTAFQTHAAVALAGIKLDQALPDTVLDRSILIRMKRATHGDLKERFRDRKHLPLFQRHGERLLRWCNDRHEQIKRCEPKIPDEVDGRVYNNWEPLISIAEVASNHWGSKLLEILLNQAEYPDESVGTRLLRDIRRIWILRDPVKNGIRPRDLAEELVRLTAIDGDLFRPWARFHANKGYREEQDTKIKSNDLPKLLTPYGLETKTIRNVVPVDGKVNYRGYLWDDLVGVQERYAPMPKDFDQDTELQGQKVLIDAYEKGVQDDYVPGEDREVKDDIPV
jgi:hypothetical protein